MPLFDLKKTVIAGAIGIMIMIAGSSNADAQSRREIERERQRVERENARYQRERQRQYQQGRSTGDRLSQRQIININFTHGYDNGYLAGTNDRRRGKYNRSNVYRDTPTGPFEGDPTNIDYIYRQGYLAGYNDGFNGRRNY